MTDPVDKPVATRDQSDAATKSNSIEIPSISLPKGGGALKGIDEKFKVNPVNGTSSYSIPCPVSASRGEFQPSLSLSYNSGNGNGIFGLGWSVDLPSIQRKTDKRLPMYRDEEDGDVFLFSGLEDLVPVESQVYGNFIVASYRPRIEGLFARIEKIIPVARKHAFYWKVTTRENVVTFFGRSESYRLADPENEDLIFQWLPEISYDDKGNFLRYIFKSEDTIGVAPSLYEDNRLNGTCPFTNKYLKHVRYGNKTPFYPQHISEPTNINSAYDPYIGPPHPGAFMFDLVFDYGDHAQDTNEELPGWPARKDAFSNYKPGFEIRTYRLCERILMFHHFDELNGGVETLVKSLDFDYENTAEIGQAVEVTYLKGIQQKGYSLQPDGIYFTESLPVLSFEYQQLQWNTEVRKIARADVIHSPVGLTGDYQWIDLFSEGIPGILSEQAEGWYYKNNLGDSHFSNAKRLRSKPSLMGLNNSALQVLELEADGTKQIVSYSQNLPGHFSISDDNEWLPFKTFPEMPTVDFKDANTRLIDLNGDGRADLLITEENAFRWYPSKGAMGFESAEYVSKSFDDEKGPAIVFSDGAQSIYLADMSGDGLTDIVRIKESGAVCYWPNLGYGRFGAKVNMGSIHFTDAFSFNPSYLQLADVTGTGTTDIVYLGNSKWQVWLNESGNKFSAPYEIESFWPTTRPAQINVVDLLGNGTPCIVWSSPMPADAPAPLQYIDLMGGRKPHNMRQYKNGMGKINTVEYKSSTKYYLDDKKSGRPWITKLPFPVQCVSKVEVIDEVANLRFTTKYTYHHGYFDHAEREFRGFGRVDQVDTEDFEYLKTSAASNASALEHHEPPLLTRTWYHTGALLRHKKILDQFETEYWYNHRQFEDRVIEEHKLSDASLPTGLSMQETLEAYRACKGMVLRTEVFALDGSILEKNPYTVVTHNCNIRMLQGKRDNTHAVFLVHENEAITFSYERNMEDPRIAHSLNLEIDGYGNILKKISVVYGRTPEMADEAIDALEIIKRQSDADVKREYKSYINNSQTPEHILFTETSVTTNNREQVNGNELIYYRLPLPWSVKTFEVHGVTKALGTYFQISDFADIISGERITRLGYHETFDPNLQDVQLRLIEQVETLFLSYDLRNPLPAGKHGALGLNYESYQLALTPALIDVLYNSDQQGNLITPERVSSAQMILGRYCHIDRDPNDVNWWIRSGTIQYFDPTNNETRSSAQSRYYVPTKFTDPFGSETRVAYPANNYFLYISRTIDALDNLIEVVDFDYRVLAARRMRDLNDNLSEVCFNALGLVTGMALMGKGNQGDDLTGFDADISSPEIAEFFDAPLLTGRTLLGNATARMVYDLQSVPARVGTVTRETHVRAADGALNAESKIQIAFEYTSGIGHPVLKKMRAENGKAKKLENGRIIEVDSDPRWVGNGRTILNNKGKPVRQYEPYFSVTHLYEAEPSLRELGVSSVFRYDSAGRMIRTDYPDGTISKVVFDSWQQMTYDQNDTIRESKWAALRGYADPDQPITVADDELTTFMANLASFGSDIVKEREALEKTLPHANTPSVVLTDSFGRPFFTIDHNAWQFKNVVDPQPAREEVFAATRVLLDVEGNTRQVNDARGNRVMKYEYNMLGQVAHTVSMDSGERWTLNDCLGKPALAWDNKNQRFVTSYDSLHRPIQISLSRNSQTSIVGKMTYGTDKAKNLNMVAVSNYDTAGVTTTTAVDFNGNVNENSRQLCRQTAEIPDWNDLSPEVFLNKAKYDALGRIIETVSPHTTDRIPSVYRLAYGKGNLLKRTELEIRGAASDPIVKGIDYDAKGQRRIIRYGNNTFTKYEFDPHTYRLRRLITCPDTPANEINFDLAVELKKTAYQFLTYTYDPVGNITNIEDEAQQIFYFDNVQIKPEHNYRYDALYRLIESQGREYIGQNLPATPYDRHRMFFLDIPSADNALRNYTQRFTYDAVNNMTELAHIVRNGQGSTGWTRTFAYAARNNQLLTTTVGNSSVQFTYDEHGNTEALPHLPSITWNFRDQLQRVQTQAGVDNDQADGASYLYDGNGQRTRKVVTKGNIVEERLYLGGFEIFRRIRGGSTIVERESLHLMDDKNRIALVESLIIDESLPLNPVQNLTRYQYTNHLDSACLELDGSARVISYEEYHAYGSTAYQNQNRNIKAAAKRYRYTGMERDEESGMQYHTARYYLPWLGRWLSADPKGILDGNNVYRFVKSNPVRYSDANGTSAWDTLYYFSENVRQFEKDMIRDIVSIPVNAVKNRMEDLSKASAAFKKGEISEGLGHATGINRIIEDVGGRYNEYTNAGASTGEALALIVGDETGFNDLAEAVSGESKYGKQLSMEDRLVKGATGTSKLAGTVATVSGGVAKVSSAIKPPVPKIIPPKIVNVKGASPNKGLSLKQITKKHNDAADKLADELNDLGVNAKHAGNKTLKGKNGKSIKGTEGTATTRKPDVVAETGSKNTGIEIKTSDSPDTVAKAQAQLANEASFEGKAYFEGKEWTIGQGSGVAYTPYGILNIFKANLNNN